MTFRELSFGHAYEFADRVAGLVLGFIEEPYLSDYLDADKPGFLERATRPSKDTLLHVLIRNINHSDVEYTARKFPSDSTAYFQHLLTTARMPLPKWLTPEHIGSHGGQLDKLAAKVVAVVAEPTFHLLFSDREFLLAFQMLLASAVRNIDSVAHAQCFESPGILRRPNRLPRWLQKAVFHRDKGVCQSCFTDLTHLVNLESDLHFDHIVPLAQGGTNDPTNFQLLCSTCNHRKGARSIRPRHLTSTFW